MKLQASKTNAPNWRDLTVKSELPAELKSLEVLAKNLWWVWNSEAKALFKDSTPTYGVRPVKIQCCCCKKLATNATMKSWPTRPLWLASRKYILHL